MTRTILLALFAALVSGSCASLAPRADSWLPQDARAEPARYVVVTVPNEVSAATPGVASTPRGYNSVAPYVASADARRNARALAEDYKLQSVASWPIAALSVHCLVYRIPSEADRQILLATLKRDPRVESAQPLENFSTQATSYNDPYAGLQRNLDELAVPQAQNWSSGKGVRLAVIDTGVDVDHVDLEGRIAAWRNFVDEDAAQFRSDRHGTAVAGVIAAVANNGLGIVGIAPEVRLYAYKACWETQPHAAAVCNTFTLARALSAAIEARVDIVNLSLAGPSDPLLARLVRRGQEAGIIFVGAAPPAQPAAAAPSAGFPVDVAGVIGVQTSESAAPRRGLIAAPGEDIFTLAPVNRYDAASGSSLAAAEVSAIVALLRARDSGLDAARTLRLFAESERPVLTSAGTRTAINACEAVAALRPGVDCKQAAAARQVKTATRTRRAF